MKKLFKRLFTRKEFNPKNLKKREEISYLWGGGVRTGIVQHNFKNSNFVFVERTDVEGKNRNVVMYYEVIEKIK